MKHITKSIPDAKAAEIVELFAELYCWTEIIDDGKGNKIPNVSKEIFVQKIFNNHCVQLIKDARLIKRNKELVAIPDEDIFN